MYDEHLQWHALCDDGPLAGAILFVRMPMGAEIRIPRRARYVLCDAVARAGVDLHYYRLDRDFGGAILKFQGTEKWH